MQNYFAALLTTHRKLGGLVLVLLSVLAGVLTGAELREQRETHQHDVLTLTAQRGAIELMAQTLNSSLMGSVAMLGLTNPHIEQEAIQAQGRASADLNALFTRAGQALAVDGLFLVTASGKVASSWDNSSKPSTGLDVGFRPYYQMAMLGQENVYAAVSLARGDRSLYFAAPIFSSQSAERQAVGAMVARTGVVQIDLLLQHKADFALLLSPQGIVFASNRPEWVGRLAATPTPALLQSIRQLRQFGAMFAQAEPRLLPLPVQDGIRRTSTGRYAVSRAPVQWHDPAGDWQLLVLEDLERSVPISGLIAPALLAGFLVLLAGSILQLLVKNQHVKDLANVQLAAYAQQQQADAVRQSQLAAVSLKLQHCKSVDELLACYFTEIHQWLGMMQGVVYLRGDDSESLLLAASFACDPAPDARLQVGEGLLGQCAIERSLRVEKLSRTGLGLLRSGLGETQPVALLLAPLQLSNTLLGVIEIAVLKPPDDVLQALFTQLNALLALNLEIVRRSAPSAEQVAVKA